MDTLQARVKLLMLGYMLLDLKQWERNVEAVCRNTINMHGAYPSDEEIEEEIEIFYNA